MPYFGCVYLVQYCVFVSVATAVASATLSFATFYIYLVCTLRRYGGRKRVWMNQLASKCRRKREKVTHRTIKCKHTHARALAQSKSPSFGRNSLCCFFSRLFAKSRCVFIFSINNIVHTSCVWLRARTMCACINITDSRKNSSKNKNHRDFKSRAPTKTAHTFIRYTQACTWSAKFLVWCVYVWYARW